MTDRRRTYISSVMATKTSGSSPDKRRKYGEAFKVEALRLAGESRSTQAATRQLGISPKLLYRWQQAQFVAEVGSADVARDPEVWALRARLARPPQAGGTGARYFKKSLGHLRPADPVSTYRHIAQRAGQVPVRQRCQVLRVAPGVLLCLAAPSTSATGRAGLASGRTRSV